MWLSQIVAYGQFFFQHLSCYCASHPYFGVDFTSVFILTVFDENMSLIELLPCHALLEMERVRKIIFQF